jgi:type IV pilus assembly protein PilY1
MKNSIASRASQSLLVAALFWSAAASAFTPAQQPLQLGGRVEPNVMFLMDDSGSMNMGFMPDSLQSHWDTSDTKCPGSLVTYAGISSLYNCGIAGNEFLASPTFNTVYYNPRVEYKLPLKADGTRYTINRSTPRIDGYNSSSSTVTLSSGYKPLINVAGTSQNLRSFILNDTGTTGPYWYRFNPSDTCVATNTTHMRKSACFTRVLVTDAVDTQYGHSANQLTNFAIWFSFYRNRMLAAKSGSLEAFMPLASTMRVGYGSINQASVAVDGGTSMNTIRQGVRLFDSTTKDNFANWLTALQPSGTTPLRRALGDAGRYYARTDDRGPWSSTPGVTGGETFSCRQSYTILTTDGYWNAAAAAATAAQADVDGDGVANTLADVAKYYWKTDLLPTVTNNVPTNRLNKQNQQHMVTFSVGLGLEGSLRPTPEEAFNAVIAGKENTLTWPDPVPTNTAVNPGDVINNARLMDLLHAAVNGRGAFFNARNPDEFAKALTDSLVSIANLSVSNTPRSASSARLREGTLIYEATYNSGNWTGQVKAYTPVETSTGLTYIERWEAGSLLGTTTRKLFTGSAMGVDKGVLMSWANVNKAFFNNDEALFNYIVGARTDEAPNGKKFRARESLLGDIVNSSLITVNRRNFQYLRSSTGLDGYADFHKAKSARVPVVYAGSNSGFLHAFNGNTGREIFAFMPYGASANISALANDPYVHRYFVDGKLHEHDVFIRTPADTTRKWRTVLVGGLGAGGKSIHALDVTDADTFGARNVLWEFTDADMGHTFGEPVVGLLADGTWAAMFGNGYGKKADNTLLDSVLYVVNLETGVLIDKLTLATNTGGMSSPGYVYTQANLNKSIGVSVIFVGDLAGNLWRLNVSNAGKLTTAFGNNNSPTPLFIARDGTAQGSKRQPITVRPVMARHPKFTDTFMVYFGTGSYMSFEDIVAPALRDVQSVYGVWASGVPSGNQFAAITSRSSLEEVKVVQELSSANAQGVDARIIEQKSAIDWTTKAGWYLDLLTAGTTAAAPKVKDGERVVQQPEILSGTLFLNTLLPSDDPCNQVDNGWLMAFDLATGGRVNQNVFDFDSSGSVVQGDPDKIASVSGQPRVVGSGIRGSGILPTGGLLIGDLSCYYYGVAVSCDTRPTKKRIAWEQLDEE